MHTAPPPAEASHRKLRFISVIAATAIALSCGTNYAYSAWAPQFSEKLHLSATSQNLIGNFGNIGMYAMGIPGGMFIDSRGPRWGVLLGAVCLAAGYFPLRSAYVGGAGSMGVPALCFFALLTGMGSCTAFSAALKVCATNWPKHRGTATAFPLSAFGLSAFAYTIAAGVVFPDDTEGYLLLLACGTTVMVFVGMFFLQTVKSGLPYEAVATEERPGLMREDSNQMRRSSVHSRVSSKGSLTESGKPSSHCMNCPPLITAQAPPKRLPPSCPPAYQVTSTSPDATLICHTTNQISRAWRSSTQRSSGSSSSCSSACAA